jgi:hypothetical protein
MEDIESELGLDRFKLADLALLLGSDYTEVSRWGWGASVRGLAVLHRWGEATALKLAHKICRVNTDDGTQTVLGYRVMADHIKLDIFWMTHTHTHTRSQCFCEWEEYKVVVVLGLPMPQGVRGIGIVNALEVVHAFSGLEQLSRFKAWVEMPDSELLALMGAGGGEDSAEDTGGSKGETSVECSKWLSKWAQ